MSLLLLFFYIENQECLFQSDVTVRTKSREINESRNPCAIILPQASYGLNGLYDYSDYYMQIQHGVYRKVRIW